MTSRAVPDASWKKAMKAPINETLDVPKPFPTAIS